MTLQERAQRFLRQCSPHHREREWHKLLEEFVQAPVSETAPLVAGDLKTQREIHDSYAPSATRPKSMDIAFCPSCEKEWSK